MKKKAEFLPAPDRSDTIEVMFNDETEEELTAAEQAANAAIEQLNSNAEKGKTIRVYRQMGNGKESMQFVMSEPADKYTVDELIDIVMRKYGGGDYRFMIYNERGKLSANKLISIATEKTGYENGGKEGGAFGLLNSLMEKQDRLTAHLVDSGKDNTSRMDFMREMIMMKEIFAGGENTPTKSAMSQMKEFAECMAMMKEIANPEPKEEENSFGKIFSEAAPLLTSIVQSAANNRQNQPPVNPAGYRPNPNTRQRKKPTQEPKQMNMQKMAINQMLEYCKRGNPADEVAGELVGKIPQQYMPQIEALILVENPVADIIKINPDVANHHDWFVDVIEWIKGYLGHPSKFDDEFLDDGAIDDGEIAPEPTVNVSPTSDQNLRGDENETIIDPNGDSEQ